jgi:hypothetical protein
MGSPRLAWLAEWQDNRQVIKACQKALQARARKVLFDYTPSEWRVLESLAAMATAAERIWPGDWVEWQVRAEQAECRLNEALPLTAEWRTIPPDATPEWLASLALPPATRLLIATAPNWPAGWGDARVSSECHLPPSPAMLHAAYLVIGDEVVVWKALK